MIALDPNLLNMSYNNVLVTVAENREHLITYPNQFLILALGEYSVAFPPNRFSRGSEHSLNRQED